LDAERQADLEDGDRPNRTAEYMALFRAVENAEPTDRRPLRALAGFARLPEPGRLATWFLDLGWPRTCNAGVLRTRLIDDLAPQAFHSGVRQALLLSAGFARGRAERFRGSTPGF